MEIKQSNSFQFQLPFILNHVVDGEIKRGKHFGVHFFQEEKHLIDKIIKQPNYLGIWEAHIKIRHYKTNNWVKKTKSSTFFPTHWTLDILIIKLQEAFENKKALKPFKHIGNTSCGIPIVFFFQKDIITSCYPLYIINSI